MTTIHDQYLELAAAAIDFELSPAERADLAAHLAECTACRRRIAALEADQREIRRLPAFVLEPATAEAIRDRALGRRVRPAASSLRLLAIAAVLAVLTIATLAVGAELLRRQRDNDLTQVPSPLPAIELPAEEPIAFVAGSTADVVVPDLRVRTAPTVDDSKSAKLEPLLGRGTQLKIVEGPVTADGYDWYRVEAIGWPHRGWVAVADHDGEPWIRAQGGVADAGPDVQRGRGRTCRRAASRCRHRLRPASDPASDPGNGRRRLPGQRRGRPADRAVRLSGRPGRGPGLPRAAGRRIRSGPGAAIAPVVRAGTRPGVRATAPPARTRTACRSVTAALSSWPASAASSTSTATRTPG